jgi:nitrite reductase/ring-hydroxylating ferredoxin subunit
VARVKVLALSELPPTKGVLVICPLHGWEFDMRTGACMTVPGESVPRYTATGEGGAVYLEEAE